MVYSHHYHGVAFERWRIELSFVEESYLQEIVALYALDIVHDRGNDDFFDVNPI